MKAAFKTEVTSERQRQRQSPARAWYSASRSTYSQAVLNQRIVTSLSSVISCQLLKLFGNVFRYNIYTVSVPLNNCDNLRFFVSFFCSEMNEMTKSENGRCEERIAQRTGIMILFVLLYSVSTFASVGLQSVILFHYYSPSVQR